MNMFGRVAVLLGGSSAERDISLQSGAAVLDGLRRAGVDAHPFDPAERPLGALVEEGFERAFIMLHGRGGEDGGVQGALEMLQVPYTGSGVLGSALGMDKYRTKLLWRGLGLPTPGFVPMHSEADLARAEALGFPLMIKPAREGSSIGMGRADDAAQLAAAYRAAAACDPMVLAERWITGPEYTVAILGDQALPMIRLETPRPFYDYAAKYEEESTRYHCPCGLDAEMEHRLQALALKAFRAVGARGWGRVDLLTDDAGTAWLIEVNTVPGMTDHSLVPMAASAAGIDFDTLVVRILEETLRDA